MMTSRSQTDAARPSFPSRTRCARCQCLPRGPAVSHSPFHAITPEYGFLPHVAPSTRLQLQGSDAWEQALHDLPKLRVASGNDLLRNTLASLPPFPTSALLAVAEEQPEEAWRAYLLLSFLAHAYMWCEDGPTPQSLPATLAVPWAAISAVLKMPPVLVYATYNLLNWRRIDPAGPVALGNLVCLHNFFGGQDEEWFRLVHVVIEAQCAAAVAGLPMLQQAAVSGDEQAVLRGLAAIAEALAMAQCTLARMGEKCDPYIYYHRVRTPMSGWRNNPLLPNGLLYEGVSSTPLQLYGETGAQSSIIHAFDAALGIHHDSMWLREYLTTMRGHMPPAHRAFLSELEVQGPVVRHYCAAAAAGTGAGSDSNSAAAAAAAAAANATVGAGDFGSSSSSSGLSASAFEAISNSCSSFSSSSSSFSKNFRTAGAGTSNGSSGGADSRASVVGKGERGFASSSSSSSERGDGGSSGGGSATATGSGSSQDASHASTAARPMSKCPMPMTAPAPDAAQKAAARHQLAAHQGVVVCASDPSRPQAPLAMAYNEAVHQLESFRAQHKAFAYAYIAKFAKAEEEQTGTGGSDFMPALQGYRETTSRHYLNTQTGATMQRQYIC